MEAKNKSKPDKGEAGSEAGDEGEASGSVVKEKEAPSEVYPKSLSQEERRQRILEEQKSLQFDFVSHAYKVTRDDWTEVTGLTGWTECPPLESFLTLPGTHYQQQLMCSEWMVEVPATLEEEWLMVPCPWGKRCLVVSGQGGTVCYSYDGILLKEFPSLLPGGNIKNLGKYNKDNAILDCIYHEIEKTFYVLDIMCWDDQQLYESETELRFFLMKSRLDEHPDVKTASKYNPLKFIPLESYSCSKGEIKSALETSSFQVDGCLFYLRQAQYTFGVSPLVLWLQPFMMEEVLGVDVPAKLMEQKPLNYSTFQEYIQSLEQQRWGGNRRGQSKQEGQKEEGDKGPRKPRGPDRADDFKVNLMMSQWLLEVPENIDKEWLAVVCPVGKRCLVIAIDGETKSFTKTGFRIPGYFVSLLPGGSKKFSEGSLTLLDCIFCQESSTYFILDLLCWDKQSVTHNTAEARFKRLHQEVSRIPSLRLVNPKFNHHKFSVLKNFPCTKEGLEKAIISTRFEIDGMLLFKKDATYVSESTPNVLWTKPYMLPEALGVSVPKSLLEEKPPAYVTFEQFVKDTKNGLTIERKKKKKKKQNAFMPKVTLDLPAPDTFNQSKSKQNSKKKKKQPQTQAYQLEPDQGSAADRFGFQYGQDNYGKVHGQMDYQTTGRRRQPFPGVGRGQRLEQYFMYPGAQRSWSPFQEDPYRRYEMYNRNQHYDPYNMTDLLGTIDYGNMPVSNRSRKVKF